MTSREKLFYFLLVSVGVFMLGWALFGADGIREVWRLDDERSQLTEEIRVLEEQKESQLHESELLREDRRVIERKAREDLGMVKKDETVIMLPEKGHGVD